MSLQSLKLWRPNVGSQPKDYGLSQRSHKLKVPKEFKEFIVPETGAKLAHKAYATLNPGGWIDDAVFCVYIHPI